MIKLLSVLIPVFNESNTIYEVLKTVSEVSLINNIQKEVIVINDRSFDGSKNEIERFIKDYPKENIVFINHEVNTGKGGAIITGIKRATGEYSIIQDADLELVPSEFNLLLKPILDDTADIVYGSRFINQKKKEKESISHHVANKFITWIGGIVFGVSLSDIQTCYKMVPTPLFKSLDLKEKRFGFDPEITAKLAKLKDIRWGEVPITYLPRTHLEGKKIGWIDGFRALYCIVRYGI